MVEIRKKNTVSTSTRAKVLIKILSNQGIDTSLHQTYAAIQKLNVERMDLQEQTLGYQAL